VAAILLSEATWIVPVIAMTSPDYIAIGVLIVLILGAAANYFGG
jgi:hypothetical protein